MPEEFFGGAAHLTQPVVYRDVRGNFSEIFHAEDLPFPVAVSNCSRSVSGTIRGIHYTEAGGQDKYITCVHGSILDIIVDLRTSSPTFGLYEAVDLDSSDLRSVYISSGLGHAFFAYEESVLLYQCSKPYAPEAAQVITPFDEGLGVNWPSFHSLQPRVSEQDALGPTLAEALERNLLPV